MTDPKQFKRTEGLQVAVEDLLGFDRDSEVTITETHDETYALVLTEKASTLVVERIRELKTLRLHVDDKLLTGLPEAPEVHAVIKAARPLMEHFMRHPLGEDFIVMGEHWRALRDALKVLDARPELRKADGS